MGTLSSHVLRPHLMILWGTGAGWSAAHVTAHARAEARREERGHQASYAHSPVTLRRQKCSLQSTGLVGTQGHGQQSSSRASHVKAPD